MSENETIDLLRREVADLRERVARLEREKATAIAFPALPPHYAAPVIPYAPEQPSPFAPYVPTAPAFRSDCLCPPGTMCMNAACPKRGGIAISLGTAGPNT